MEIGAPKMQEPKKIKSGTWVRIIKDEETNEVIVEQGPNTTFEDAIGLLHSAIIKYETQFKIQIEMQNLEKVNTLVGNIAKNISELAQHAHLIENATIKMAAATQNIMRGNKNV